MKTLKEMMAPNKHPVIQAIQRANQSKKFVRADAAPSTVPGVKKVGAGVYGSVYEKNANSVVKVYHDPAYHEFVKYAKANQDDPHLPKIHSSGKIKGTPYHYVKMEKLDDVSINGIPKGYSHVLSINHETSGEPKDMKTMLHHDPVGKELAKKNPTLHKSMDKLLDHFPNGGFDLHGSNMMVRKSTGHIVITDPITSSGRSENDLHEMITLNKHPNATPFKTSVDGTKPQTAYDISPKLHAAGLGNSSRFRMAGSGYFGVAMHDKKHGNVVKIHADPAYNTFIKFAKENQDDPHLPKIQAMGKIKGTPYHYVKMEKLVHHTSLSSDGDTHPDVGKLTNALRYYKGAKYQDHTIKFGHQLHHMLTQTDQGHQIQQQYPGLHKTLTKFAQQHPNHMLDLHSGNFMVREKTKHIVLTDPIKSFTPNASKPGSDNDTFKMAPRFSKLSKDSGILNMRLEPGSDASAHEKLVKEMMAPNKHPLIKQLQSDPTDTGSKGIDRRLDPESQLGAGVGGTAYKRSKNDTVVKVYRDSGYHEFAKYAKKNQNDPHMPKIYAHGRIKDSPYAAVRMEKLEHIKPDHPLYKHISASYQRPGPNGALYDLDHLKNYDPENNLAHKRFHEEFPTVSHSLLKMKEKFPRHGLDFHHGNVMQRDDGTPVITDPLFPGDYIGRAKTHMKEDAPTNSAGGGHIAGIGIGPQGEPGRPGPMLRRSKFAGQEVFEVKSDVFHQARMSKQKHLHWKSYIGEDDTGAAIREFANKNPKKAIILKDERTGAMHYARFGTK